MTRVTITSFRPQEGSVLQASGNLKADPTLDVHRAKSDGALLNKHVREDLLYQTPRLHDNVGPAAGREGRLQPETDLQRQPLGVGQRQLCSRDDGVRNLTATRPPRHRDLNTKASRRQRKGTGLEMRNRFNSTESNRKNG